MVLSDCSYDDEIDSPDPQIVPVILRTVKDPIHAMSTCFLFGIKGY
jgi:hypothetical protein